MAKAVTPTINSTAARQVSGIKLTPDKSGFMLDWETLPAIENFFVATDFLVKRDLSSLVIIFGSVSAFEEHPERFDQAVEVRIPLYEAKTFLYEGSWEKPGSNGKEPFTSTLAHRTKPHAETVQRYKCQLKLPANKDASFRKFASNFCSLTFSGGQALIEFFEASPDLLLFLMRGQALRPQAGLKIVMGVIIDPVRLHSLLIQTKAILENLTPQDMGILEEATQ